MPKYTNAYLLTAIAVISLASCSTLLPTRKTNTVSTDDSIDTLAVALPAIDSLEIPLEEGELSPLDSLFLLTPDTTQPADSDSADEEVEQELPEFFFEGGATTAVMIDEYRNAVVEDITLDLSQENSHYPALGHVTSVYGWRRNRMHAGIDLKAYTGDNLYAAFDGVVRLAKYYSSFGNCVIIRHYNGLETLYAHASKLLVKVNDKVKAGDVIAYAGNTGRSTGSHLHFEVRAGGHYFNPNLILDTENRKIKDANLYVTMRNGRLFASNNDNEEEREAYILEQISIKYYVVRSGDNLSRIAVNNGTTVATLCRLNGISSKSILRVGQRLIVRDGVKSTTKTATAKSTASATTSKSTTAAPSNSANTTRYKIKNGDTLGKIAKNHGTTVSALCSLNNISSSTTIRAGEYLSVPGAGGSSPATAAPTAQKSSANHTGYYTVVSGDSLSEIAQKHHTTVSALCSLNGISTNSTLRIGQRLKVSSSAAESTPQSINSSDNSTTSTPEYYKVKSGDTLGKIAKRYGTTVSKLCQLNNISSTSTLQIGQRLKVK
ncbi:MAG: LysM peptidoglycan-binding domain-containing protein [Rikenellaceae bacterium]